MVQRGLRGPVCAVKMSVKLYLYVGNRNGEVASVARRLSNVAKNRNYPIRVKSESHPGYLVADVDSSLPEKLRDLILHAVGVKRVLIAS